MKPEEKKEVQNRLQKMLDGKIKSDNEFVNYALDELRGLLVSQNTLRQQIEKARIDLSGMETRLVELGAQFEKYADDIRHFDEGMKDIKKKHNEPPKSVEKKGKKEDEKTVDVNEGTRMEVHRSSDSRPEAKRTGSD